MRISISNHMRSSCVELRVKPEAYEYKSWQHPENKRWQFWAELSPYQLRKLEKACGGQPSQWFLHTEDGTYAGYQNELKMQLARLACTNNGRETWAIVWGRNHAH